jgi:signal transduction histidine kinase
MGSTMGHLLRKAFCIALLIAIAFCTLDSYLELKIASENRDDAAASRPAWGHRELVIGPTLASRTRRARALLVCLGGGLLVAAAACAHERDAGRLRHSEQRFRTLFEHSPIPLWEQDWSLLKALMDKHPRWCAGDAAGWPPALSGNMPLVVRVTEHVGLNPAALALFGAESAESLVDSAQNVFTDDLDDRLFAVARRLASGEQSLAVNDVQLRTLDGRPLDLTIHVRLLPGTSERWERVLLSFQDQTPIKQLEAQRRARVAWEEQERKLEGMRIMAGQLAHDFNNLLATIQGNAASAAHDLPESAPAQRCLEDIRIAAGTAGSLCEELFTYAGKAAHSPEPVAVNAVLRELIRALEFTLMQRARLVPCLSPDLPDALADPGQLRQVLMNLLTNAAEAVGDDGGVIRIRTCTRACTRAELASPFLPVEQHAGEYVVASISDNGCGMPPETIKRIFDPFFTTKKTGKGLGLAAVLGMVRNHRGSIRIDSDVGRGTTVDVYLPVAETQTARPPPNAAHDRRAAETQTGKGHVLIAEDEAPLRELVQRMVERIGFEVLPAATGQEAIDVYNSNAQNIRCVVLDMTMPDGDGAEALRELRSKDPTLPVVLASGHHEGYIRSRFTGAHQPTHIVQKPYTYEQLRDILLGLLGEREN